MIKRTLKSNVKNGAIAILTRLASVSLVLTEAIFSPAYAAQQLFCTRRMKNGWNYTAPFLDLLITDY